MGSRVTREGSLSSSFWPQGIRAALRRAFLVPVAQGPVILAFCLLFIARVAGDLFLTMFEDV